MSRSLPKTYRRMTIWERGHFSNSFRLNPVVELEVSEEALSIKRKFGSRQSYAWRDIEAFCTKRRAHKSYGAGTGSSFTLRELHIVTEGETYSIDVSSDFPDFKQSRNMLMALKKHLFIFDR